MYGFVLVSRGGGVWSGRLPVAGVAKRRGWNSKRSGIIVNVCMCVCVCLCVIIIIYTRIPRDPFQSSQTLTPSLFFLLFLLLLLLTVTTATLQGRGRKQKKYSSDSNSSPPSSRPHILNVTGSPLHPLPPAGVSANTYVCRPMFV